MAAHFPSYKKMFDGPIKHFALFKVPNKTKADAVEPISSFTNSKKKQNPMIFQTVTFHFIVHLIVITQRAE